MDTAAGSARRSGYVAKVKTPTLFLHGENDNDVPIAEAEQFYIALKDVGVETVMVRYPREGHGLRETKHVVDSIDRSIACVPTSTSSDQSWRRGRDGSRLTAQDAVFGPKP